MLNDKHELMYANLGQILYIHVTLKKKNAIYSMSISHPLSDVVVPNDMVYFEFQLFKHCFAVQEICYSIIYNY